MGTAEPEVAPVTGIFVSAYAKKTYRVEADGDPRAAIAAPPRQADLQEGGIRLRGAICNAPMGGRRWLAGNCAFRGASSASRRPDRWLLGAGCAREDELSDRENEP